MSPSSPDRLRSILGMGFGLAGALGDTSGAGILGTPELVAVELPTPQLVLEAVLAGMAASELLFCAATSHPGRPGGPGGPGVAPQPAPAAAGTPHSR